MSDTESQQPAVEELQITIVDVFTYGTVDQAISGLRELHGVQPNEAVRIVLLCPFHRDVFSYAHWFGEMVKALPVHGATSNLRTWSDLFRDIRELADACGTDADHRYKISTESLEVTWSDGDRAVAQSQGWDIFDADGSEDGRWQLQSIAAPWDHPHLKYTEPKFDGDTAAAAFVQARADAGDITCQRAIAFLVSVGSGDVAKFKLRHPG